LIDLQLGRFRFPPSLGRFHLSHGPLGHTTLSLTPHTTAGDEGKSKGAGVRIARYLAMAGIASRRACEDLVRGGLVTLNGAVVEQLSARVSPREDQVCCDGQAVVPEALTYILLNKPPGYTCSASDRHAEALARDLLPAELGRVFSVGRLDRDSEGLILFTNDGSFAQRLSHPRYRTSKTYRVAFSGEYSPSICQRMKQGIRDEGELLRVEALTCIRQDEGGGVLELILREGRKREIRRLCRRCHLRVDRLVRIAIGDLRDGQLQLGKWRRLTDAEVAGLLLAGRRE
jgi:23S rRNA pseudouridine2605 synthase